MALQHFDMWLEQDDIDAIETLAKPEGRKVRQMGRRLMEFALAHYGKSLERFAEQIESNNNLNNQLKDLSK